MSRFVRALALVSLAACGDVPPPGTRRELEPPAATTSAAGVPKPDPSAPSTGCETCRCDVPLTCAGLESRCCWVWPPSGSGPLPPELGL